MAEPFPLEPADLFALRPAFHSADCPTFYKSQQPAYLSAKLSAVFASIQPADLQPISSAHQHPLRLPNFLCLLPAHQKTHSLSYLVPHVVSFQQWHSVFLLADDDPSSRSHGG